MGKFWDWFTQVTPVDGPTQNQPTHRFAIGDNPYETWRALVGGYVGAGRVSRREAMAVPAIKAARDKFAGLGSLPLHIINATGNHLDSKLLTQPESRYGLTRSVTMARTIDDLFFEGQSLWIIRDRDRTTGFPTSVQHPEYGSWSYDEKRHVMKVGTEEIPWESCILFTSPNDALCTASAATVRALLRLEATALMYAERPELSEYFTPNDGATPNEAEIQDFLTDYTAARKAGTVGFVPGGLNRVESKRMTAEELQLIGAREFGISEVSRLTGLNPNWLALNTTTRTYSNMTDERRDFIDFAAAPYLHAIEERLSLDDVIPRGQYVKWNLNGFLRSNTTERYGAYATALSNGFLTINEVRALEDLPELTPGVTNE